MELASDEGRSSRHSCSQGLCLRAGLLGTAPTPSPLLWCVWNHGQFSWDTSLCVPGNFFSLKPFHVPEVSQPASQELWQSQGWPLLHPSIFTVDSSSNDSALITQIICTILSLIYWFLYSCEHELISSPCFLLLVISLKRTGLFPSPPASSHLPGATWHCWGTATHFEGFSL